MRHKRKWWLSRWGSQQDQMNYPTVSAMTSVILLPRDGFIPKIWKSVDVVPLRKVNSQSMLNQWPHHQFNVTNNANDDSLQNSVLTWSLNSNMHINPTKTKEMLVSFSKVVPHVHALTIANETIAWVTDSKLLGMVINEKCNGRPYFIS